jgi:hypothetical protein
MKDASPLNCPVLEPRELSSKRMYADASHAGGWPSAVSSFRPHASRRLRTVDIERREADDPKFSQPPRLMREEGALRNLMGDHVHRYSSAVSEPSCEPVSDVASRH